MVGIPALPKKDSFEFFYHFLRFFYGFPILLTHFLPLCYTEKNGKGGDKMNCKRKLTPVEPYEIGALESWFSDLSAEGLHLQDVNSLYGLFAEKEPHRMIYHIEPKNPYHDSRPPIPQLERYEEKGWSFVCTLEPHFYIFSAEESTPELHTEPEELSLYTKYTRGDTPPILLFHLLMAATLILLFISECKKLLLWGSENIKALHYVPFSHFLFLLLFWLVNIHRMNGIHRLKKDLREGVLRKYETDWQNSTLRFRHIFYYICWIPLLAVFLLDYLPLWSIFL